MSGWLHHLLVFWVLIASPMLCLAGTLTHPCPEPHDLPRSGEIAGSCGGPVDPQRRLVPTVHETDRAGASGCERFRGDGPAASDARASAPCVAVETGSPDPPVGAPIGTGPDFCSHEDDCMGDPCTETLVRPDPVEDPVDPWSSVLFFGSRLDPDFRVLSRISSPTPAAPDPSGPPLLPVHPADLPLRN